MVEVTSIREAFRVFGLHRDTANKMLAYSVSKPFEKLRMRPTLASLTESWMMIIGFPGKQRHMAKRIYERLRDEYAFAGRYTIVNDCARKHRRRNKEMLVPLSRPPRHSRRDFGDAPVVVEGVEQKAHRPSDADH